ncbi:uncharacterized protein zgc:174906 [Scyliorhinus canicula]|uniref:uncharacterized protein zgc:174906 n=1 Tax=Scyliorhinus canicula TaxID=7830 RepID=UPI0018F5A811|nr:uncharacterized protein zgc:174906 [Scyliorhinus canicula]
MATAKFLLQVLDELSQDELERFKFHLQNTIEFKSIATGLLENKTRVELAHLLQKHFAEQALDISKHVLLQIPRHDLVTKMFGKGDMSDSEGRDPEKRKRGRVGDCGTASSLSENEMPTSKKNKVETKVLKDKTLMALAETMGHNWKQIGIQFLELKGYVIDQCELKEATVILQSFEMLKSWRNREKEEATALKLHSILANGKCPIGSEQLECLLEDNP